VIVSSTETTTSTPYVELTCSTHDPRPVPGYKFRISDRWSLKSNILQYSTYRIPYFSVSGKFSGFFLGNWRTTPKALFASNVSTVYQRLRNLLLGRHKFSYVNSLTTVILRCACLYVITQDAKIIDRFLGTMKRRAKAAVKRLLYNFASKLDGNERFVLNQVCLQTNWFTFRAERPCDKSSIKWKKYSWLQTEPRLRLPCVERVYTSSVSWWGKPTPVSILSVDSPSEEDLEMDYDSIGTRETQANSAELQAFLDFEVDW